MLNCVPRLFFFYFFLFFEKKGSLRQLQHVALHGFSSWPECNRTLEGRAVHVDNTDWGKDSNSPIILYTDPMLAVEASALGSFKIQKNKKM